MLTALDLHQNTQAAELQALQQAAYRQEAILIGYPDLPPLYETRAMLMACGESVLAWREDGRLLGALGYLHDDLGLDICRLVVAPAAQRRGIARQLLGALFAAHPGQPVRVMTASANLPALALYAQLGFRAVRETTLPDGLRLTGLQHGAA